MQRRRVILVINLVWQKVTEVHLLNLVLLLGVSRFLGPKATVCFADLFDVAKQRSNERPAARCPQSLKSGSLKQRRRPRSFPTKWRRTAVQSLLITHLLYFDYFSSVILWNPHWKAAWQLSCFEEIVQCQDELERWKSEAEKAAARSTKQSQACFAQLHLAEVIQIMAKCSLV